MKGSLKESQWGIEESGKLKHFRVSFDSLKLIRYVAKEKR